MSNLSTAASHLLVLFLKIKLLLLWWFLKKTFVFMLWILKTALLLLFRTIVSLFLKTVHYCNKDLVIYICSVVYDVLHDLICYYILGTSANCRRITGRKKAASTEGSLKNQRLSLHLLARSTKVCTEEVLSLLKQGSEIDARNLKGDTPLHCAVQFENYEICNVLLKLGANVNIKNSDGLTPLHICTKHSKSTALLDLAKNLLNTVSDVNAKDKHGNSPLHYAALKGQFKLVKLLLNFGADVHVTNNLIQTPLVFAVRGQNVEIVKLLIDNGSDVNNVDVTDIRTPLHWACSRKNVEIIRCLLENGSNVNALNAHAQSPLMKLPHYILHHDIDLLELLLEYGADINMTVTLGGRNILSIMLKFPDRYWKSILKHIAKLQLLKYPVHSCIIESISTQKSFINFFTECTKELFKAKNMKIHNCSITFLNLLIDDERKLVKYAGNEDLIHDCLKINLENTFPIYASAVKDKLLKGLESRKSWDDAAFILSVYWPTFNPTHLIVRDVLNCLEPNDWSKLVEV